jgi:hypothetical protein
LARKCRNPAAIAQDHRKRIKSFRLAWCITERKIPVSSCWNLHRGLRLTSNVRSLQETHAQCELAVMRKAMHAAEEMQSPVLRCCAAARSKVNWFVGADHSVGRGCRTHRGLSVLRRPTHGFFGHRPSRARSFSRGAYALGIGCTSRASAACEPRVAASREAVAYCGMRKAALLQHPGLAEVVREVQA